MAPRWEVAHDAEEIHELVLASDAHTANERAPAPARELRSTARRVGRGDTYVLRVDGQAVATFSLSRVPPYDPEQIDFPPAASPLYLSRLAVWPDHPDGAGLAGPRALRTAIRMARAAGADAIRSEANPDLGRVFEMLELHGFVVYASERDAEGRARAYLQKQL